MTADGAGLVIAGHTHGGQLAVPLVGALVTNCDLDRRRAKGLSRWWPGADRGAVVGGAADAAWLHVSAGLGTSPYAPVRFACRPEATLLTLTARGYATVRPSRRVGTDFGSPGRVGYPRVLPPAPGAADATGCGAAW